jgi:transcriptional regulator with XRE-family HTH domain
VSDDAPARAFYDLAMATMKRLGKNKTWLAQRSQVNRNTIENWAKQPRPPQSATVLQVADALGIEHDRALRLAGLAERPPEGEALDLASVPTDELLAEVRRRIPD